MANGLLLHLSQQWDNKERGKWDRQRKSVRKIYIIYIMWYTICINRGPFKEKQEESRKRSRHKLKSKWRENTEMEKWRRERERWRQAGLASEHRGRKLAVMLMPGSSQPARLSLNIQYLTLCLYVWVCGCMCACSVHFLLEFVYLVMCAYI